MTWGPRPELYVLGPIAGAARGTTLDLGSVLGRRLLAYLALRDGEHPTRDEAMEVVWPDGPPRTAAKSLANLVHRLRGQLGDEAVVWHGSGYLLDRSHVDLDHRRFDIAAHDAAASFGDGRPAAAAALSRHALAMWRGTPWSELDHVDDAIFDRARLIELRTAVHETLAESTLATGGNLDAIAVAQELTTSHPYRERVWWVLALGLFRDRRRRHSLAALQAARAALVEVGLDPGPDLLDLESRVLADDPGLYGNEVFGWRRAPAPTVPAPSPLLVAGLRW